MLKGKTALITGSTSGIGLGIARQLASEGVDLVLNGFGDQQEIDLLLAGIATEFNVKTSFHGADMSKPAEIRAMIEFAAQKLGRIDILVNNAGIQHTSSVDDFPEDKWDAIMAINLSANFHSIKAVLPHMKKNDWGRIINIASVHGLVGSVNKSAYVAAKHGVIGLTKVVALENARSNITCNAICPGWVLTPLVQKQIDDRAAREHSTADVAKMAMLSEKQPSCEFAIPEQIGGIVLFLCSDSARQMQGACITADGGWTAQ